MAGAEYPYSHRTDWSWIENAGLSITGINMFTGVDSGPG